MDINFQEGVGRDSGDSTLAVETKKPKMAFA